ncbi:MAG: hypothetical protein ABW170_15830, partial [Candidatus Thiodiazotropha sp. L084R]
RKARRVYSLTSRLPGTNRLGFQPSLALSECDLDFIPNVHKQKDDIQRIMNVNYGFGGSNSALLFETPNQ